MILFYPIYDTFMSLSDFVEKFRGGGFVVCDSEADFHEFGKGVGDRADIGGDGLSGVSGEIKQACVAPPSGIFSLGPEA